MLRPWGLGTIWTELHILRLNLFGRIIRCPWAHGQVLSVVSSEMDAQDSSPVFDSDCELHTFAPPWALLVLQDLRDYAEHNERLSLDPNGRIRAILRNAELRDSVSSE